MIYLKTKSQSAPFINPRGVGGSGLEHWTVCVRGHCGCSGYADPDVQFLAPALGGGAAKVAVPATSDASSLRWRRRRYMQVELPRGPP